MDPERSLGAVPRRSSISREAFHAEFRVPRRPLVLTGASWPAMSRWTLEFFEQLDAPDRSRQVEVAVLDDGGVTGYYARENRDMPLREYLERLRRPETDGPGQYLRLGTVVARSASQVGEAILPAVFADLAEDVRYFDLFDPATHRQTNLWLGGGGNVSGLHFDLEDNLLTVIRGRKRALLFAPDQTPHLHPVPLYEHVLLHSLFEPSKPDYETCPRAREARYMSCDLGPGDTLFLPAGYWHHVSSEGINVAVNTWYAPLPETRDQMPCNRFERRDHVQFVRAVTSQPFHDTRTPESRLGAALGDACADRLMDDALGDAEYFRIRSVLREHPTVTILECVGLVRSHFPNDADMETILRALAERIAVPTGAITPLGVEEVSDWWAEGRSLDALLAGFGGRVDPALLRDAANPGRLVAHVEELANALRAASSSSGARV